MAAPVINAGAGVGVAVGTGVGVAVGTGVGFGVLTGVAVGFAVGVRLAVAFGVTVARALGVGDGETEALGLAEGVAAGVCLGAGDFAARFVGVVLGNGITDDAAVGSGVKVGAGVAVAVVAPCPKKRASSAPSSKPANTTRMMSGRIGIPPLGSSGSRRRRRNSPKIYCNNASTWSACSSTKSSIASLSRPVSLRA